MEGNFGQTAAFFVAFVVLAILVAKLPLLIGLLLVAIVAVGVWQYWDAHH